MNLDNVPLWAFFFGTVAIILGSVDGGHRFGRLVLRRSKNEKESPAATMGAALLGLVAFILAFTFSIAAGRFDNRKELVRNDANAIGTAWLRADFLQEPSRSEIKTLLREYLGVRLIAAESRDVAKVRQAVDDSSTLQYRIWAVAAAEGKKHPDSDVVALLVEALNSVFDIHAIRVAIAIDTRIPIGIWALLYALCVLAMMATGYQTAISGSKRSWTGAFLAVAFGLVILLIAALDRPNTPLASVTQKPLHDLAAFMDQSPDGPVKSAP